MNWLAVALGIAPLIVADTASAQNGMVIDGMGVGGWMGGEGGCSLQVPPPSAHRAASRLSSAIDRWPCSPCFFPRTGSAQDPQTPRSSP